MPSFTATVTKFIGSHRAQRVTERPSISRPRVPQWAQWDRDLIDINEAQLREDIIRRPIDVLLATPVTQVEKSWSPLMKFVELENAQDNEAIRLRAVNLL